MLSTAPGRNKVKVATLLCLALASAACGPDPRTPRGAAEAFLDAYYVRIDLPRARELTSGVARQKVEQEIELTRGQAIDETTRQPHVRYKLLEERPGGADGVSFVYRGDIRIDDADDLERRWLVTVRHDGNGWTVTNFQDAG
jgi:hypothetical protein